MKLKERFFWFVSGGVTATTTAALLILFPLNPFTKLFRANIEVVNEKVIIGAYPLRDDLKMLKREGVKTIITLLDPKIAYEKVLLDQERELIKEFDMELLSFPMGSILGQKMGDYYQANAEAAVDAIAKSPHKVYMHCYLGVHRTGHVQKLLYAKNISFELKDPQLDERSDDIFKLEQAEKEFSLGHYELALKSLDEVKHGTDRAFILAGNTFLRLQRFKEAKEKFTDAISINPEAYDALDGLGYSSLHMDNLAEAKTYFERKISRFPDDFSANEGLGIIYKRNGDKLKAKSYFLKALQKDPNNREVLELMKGL